MFHNPEVTGSIPVFATSLYSIEKQQFVFTSCCFAMKKLTSLIQIEYDFEYENEYDMSIVNYTIPKIYHANYDISKRWYVYFSYRNPLTGKMERQPPVYWIVNKFQTVNQRIRMINRLRNILEKLLRNNLVPTKYQETFDLSDNSIGINQAIEKSIDDAKNRMKESSFNDYKQRIRKFEKWMNKNHYYGLEVDKINKKIVLAYLNNILKETSPKNRNNNRAVLSIFFSFLEENEYISDNFVKKISVLNTKPVRNKTYTPQQESKIYELLEEQDPHLHLFIKFVSYNFLRPVEVCRLRIKDIDFINGRLIVDAKNKIGKTKIIPKILLNEIIKYKDCHPDHYLFSPNGVGEYAVSETQRRSYWGKRFSKIKKHLNLDKDYTIYSFRHTFITKLYRELRTLYPPYETKSRLMLITGHTSMNALEKYLRDIDAELPEDYSDLLK